MHTVLVDTGFIHDPAHRGAVQSDAGSNIGIFAFSGMSLQTRLGSFGLVGRGAMPMLQAEMGFVMCPRRLWCWPGRRELRLASKAWPACAS